MKKIIVLLLILTNAQFSQWVKQNPPADVNALICMDFYNQNSGVAGGWKFFNGYIGRAIYTTNSGVNWLISTLPDSARAVVKIQMLNLSTGFIAGSCNTNVIDYNTRHRKNSGFLCNPPEFMKRYFSSIGMDHDEIYSKGMFLKTTDGGQHWLNWGSLPANIQDVVGLKFININTGFITASIYTGSAEKYEILKTSDGGSSWSSSIVKDSVYLYDIFSIDDNNIFVCGLKFSSGTPNGIILKSTNSGVNWVTQFISNTIQIKDISFPNSTTGFAIAEAWGISVKILKTTDSGNNWSISVTLPVNTELNRIKFVYGQEKGIATGADNITSFSRSLIYRTTNSGANWSSYSINDSNIFNDQSLIDQNIWFVCGGISNPIIYKSFNGGAIGIKQLGNQIPVQFSLYQNYPNPFNPTTKIKFDIALDSRFRGNNNVLLKVYDALGREVQTLVNEPLQPGTYEVDFPAPTGDGSNLASGIYYYTFSARDYLGTKKMIILK
jgi:photosystem II stability/assembly factor-like uncharacterized protein